MEILDLNLVQWLKLIALCSVVSSPFWLTYTMFDLLLIRKES